MAINLFWRCEGTTFSGTDDFSAADDTPSALGGASISIASAAAKVGSNGISTAPSVTSHYAFDASGIVGMVGSAGYWYQAVSANPAAGSVAGFQVVGVTTTNLINVLALSTDEIQFRNAKAGGSNSNLSSTAANLAPDTWYGIIIRWDFTTPSSSSKKLEVYDSAGNLLSGLPAELTGADLSASVPLELATLQCGRHSSGSASTQYADNFIVSDSYDGVTAAMLAYTSYTQFTAGTTNITPNPAAVSV